ncbi:MAG: efflux RND transporter periplasmic adaptor subunit [Desulfovibrio sp.]|nr:efflux RND transporter periplasmic adaptor subunit [Desulfovibrio sp.]
MNNVAARNRFLRFALFIAIFGVGLYVYRQFRETEPERESPRPRTVRAAPARTGDVDVYIQALGTATPQNTVTVRSRVDGELMALHFAEGQMVASGDLLAEIDPRPYKVQLQQARGALMTDEALLTQAERELERYRKLIKEHSVSAQQMEAQEGEVGRQQGAVLSDRAAVAEAELMLEYCSIRSPVSGRAGLRKMDPGNMIRASDADGIVVITQQQPMNVIFTLVENQIADVLKAMSGNVPPLVEVRGQDGALIENGEFLTIDNQIDTATGTVKAKAVFANKDGLLFPNRFVNVRLRIATLKDVLIVPTSAVQRNSEGPFVYMVEDGKARTRKIRLGWSRDMESVVEEGLKAGDMLVTDGVDRLRDGMPVAAIPALAP